LAPLVARARPRALRVGTQPMIKIGTRGSPLALVQAQAVAAPLRALGADVEIVPVRTEGDRRLEVQLAAIGGKGLFVREIEEMLLGGALDCAVHSLKDLPAEVPAGLTLAAFPEREDPRDVLVTRRASRFEDLRAGARLGTGSPRRRALALALRPDLVVEPVRGNVGTRLGKLASEDGRKVLRTSAVGAREEPERLGQRLADALLDQGATSVTPLKPVMGWRG